MVSKINWHKGELMLGNGEGERDGLRPRFNRSIVIDFQEAEAASENGVME